MIEFFVLLLIVKIDIYFYQQTILYISNCRLKKIIEKYIR